MPARADLLPFPTDNPRQNPAAAPDPPPREIDDQWPPELDQRWDVFVPEDDYEPLPEYGDFWTEQDAA